uniref:Uncharacterized protein n=1 Tax=Cryptomonas curvata TaxID=233186 RepID=A0A7S0MN83_9CRYP
MGVNASSIVRCLMLKQDLRFLFIGPRSAGKSTLFRNLSIEHLVSSQVGSELEKMKIDNFDFTIVNLDVDYRARLDPERWRMSGTRGIIFLVDSDDRAGMVTARDEIHRVMNIEELRDAVLLVYANKQDLPTAMRAPEISEGLRLHALRQRCCIQPLCAQTLLGFAEGMEWLCFEVAVRETSRQHPQHPPAPDTLPRPSASTPRHGQDALPACAPRERAGAAREPCKKAPQPAWAQVVRVDRRRVVAGRRRG